MGHGRAKRIALRAAGGSEKYRSIFGAMFPFALKKVATSFRNLSRNPKFPSFKNKKILDRADKAPVKILAARGDDTPLNDRERGSTGRCGNRRTESVRTGRAIHGNANEARQVRGTGRKRRAALTGGRFRLKSGRTSRLHRDGQA